VKEIKTFLILLVFLMGLSTTTSSQIREIHVGKIGFACDDTGEASWAVKRVFLLIKESKHESIAKLIHSRNTANQFLGVLLLEILEETNQTELTKEQKGKILKIYSSEEFIEVCEGCEYFEKIKLKKLLNKKKSHRMKKEAISLLKTRLNNTKVND
jgi:hypothetical protein